MIFKSLLLKFIRKLFRTLCPSDLNIPNCELNRSLANEEIYDLLTAQKPCMISRLGSVEIGCVTNFLSIKSKKPLLLKCFNFVTQNTGLPWWDNLYLSSMPNNAGVFPGNYKILEQFSKRYLQDILEMDMIASFNNQEKYMPLRSDIKCIHLETLYPFWTEKPWTLALRGKKVLVVHPFVETIKKQYVRRCLLFDNFDILPEFELKTLRAVQSNAGNKAPFKDWFEALHYMEEGIAKIDFDICILGCGAYGLPLAAYIKRMGKKAIHMGGGAQLLFGVKGKRWEDPNYGWKELPKNTCTEYYKLFNEYWVRPSKEETPVSATNVEGACYW